MPKVSVIIPTYNRSYLIADTLRSVAAQSFRDFEIVIIDDGSTDNTQEVVSAFPVRYYRQDNRGTAAAANRGFELSCGEYIAFFSSDDLFLPHALDRGVEVLDRHPGLAFTHGQAYSMDDRGRIFGLKGVRGAAAPRPRRPCPCVQVLKGAEVIERFLACGNYVCTPTVMARRTHLFDVGLFDPTCRSEDFDLLVRLAKKYDVGYIAEPLVKYRIHVGSSGSVRNLGEVEKSNTRIFENIFNDPLLGPRFSFKRPTTYFHLYLRLASYAYGIRRMNNARQYLKKALKFYSGGVPLSLWLPWLFLFAKTWFPVLALSLAQRAKHSLKTVSWRGRQRSG